MTHSFPKALIISESPAEMRFLYAFLVSNGYEVDVFNCLDQLNSVELAAVSLLCVDVEMDSGIIESICKGLSKTHLSLILFSFPPDNLVLTRWVNESIFLSIENGFSISVVVVQINNRFELQDESFFKSAAFSHLCYSANVVLPSYEVNCDHVVDSTQSFSYSSISSFSVESATKDCLSCIESEYFLDSTALQSVDPLPFILRSTELIPGLQKHSKPLCMIVSELFSNALEHGVLGLNSDLKKTPEGFSNYFLEKQKRLKEISNGFVSIKMHANRSLIDRSVTVVVEDSGKGYNPDLIAIEANQEGVPYNRGLYLVRYLSEEVTVSPKGNKTTILFKWTL
ncbi:ATP-binding protein [Marinomonas algicola]|uniref:ATP-binding protein n=1 Tax=Marinomonas algicola TaxID=2773454 RepID=UPI0017499934|nr:ATP-binding protein [Marinomonas algicola]